jgi:hypothetical protein
MGYDAWLTTDVEGERQAAKAEYCAEHHPDFEGDYCPRCEEEEERDAQGPDPDDINDRRREEAYRDMEQG